MRICRADFHIVVGDVQDAPGLRAQTELIAEPALPDEFLVQLADHRFGVGEAQVKIAAVGNGAARLIKDEIGAWPRGERILGAIDHGALAQLANRRVGVPALEHRHH